MQGQTNLSFAYLVTAFASLPPQGGKGAIAGKTGKSLQGDFNVQVYMQHVLWKKWERKLKKIGGCLSVAFQAFNAIALSYSAMSKTL